MVKIYLAYQHRCDPQFCKFAGVTVLTEIETYNGATSYALPEMRCIETDDILFIYGRFDKK